MHDFTFKSLILLHYIFKKMNFKKLIFYVKIPLLFVIIMWVIKLIEIKFNLSFIDLGVLPRRLSGLKGILFSPIIHKDINHLINNSSPVLILGSLLFFFYYKIRYKLLGWLYITSGLFLWSIGRDSFHIGASGLIYALAGFIFFSGLIRNNKRLSALSLVVIFIYGSMFWGVFPTYEHVSWEGHLSGLVAGLILAIYFKNEGPKKDIYQWEIDEENEENERNEGNEGHEGNNKNENEIQINYNYIEK